MMSVAAGTTHYVLVDIVLATKVSIFSKID